jgi:hypothetical protein
MPTPPITREQAQEALDAFNRYGRIKTYAAASLGMNRSTYRDRLDAAVMLGVCDNDAIASPAMAAKAHSIRTDRTGAVTGETVTLGKPPGDVFTPLPGQVIKGESAYVDAEGRIIGRWIKTGEGPLVDWGAALKDALAGFHGIVAPGPSPSLSRNDLMTVYVIPDAHMGLLAWGKETGENYDLDIARDTILSSLADLIGRASPSREAVILWLGDTTHQNDRTNMTPRSGHVLDVDGRWQKVLTATAGVALKAADMAAEKHERVTVRFIPGNHDPDAAVALTVALSLAYASHERVTVDDSPSPHWFRRHGKTLLGATHGHTMKPEAMAMMLATDRPEDWGASKHRYFLFGHVHHASVKEVASVRVESFNSPAAKDAFAHAGGWRSARALHSITYHSERGETTRHRVNI